MTGEYRPIAIAPALPRAIAPAPVAGIAAARPVAAAYVPHSERHDSDHLGSHLVRIAPAPMDYSTAVQRASADTSNVVDHQGVDDGLADAEPATGPSRLRAWIKQRNEEQQQRLLRMQHPHLHKQEPRVIAPPHTYPPQTYMPHRYTARAPRTVKTYKPLTADDVAYARQWLATKSLRCIADERGVSRAHLSDSLEPHERPRRGRRPAYGVAFVPVGTSSPAVPNASVDADLKPVVPVVAAAAPGQGTAVTTALDPSVDDVRLAVSADTLQPVDSAHEHAGRKAAEELGHQDDERMDDRASEEFDARLALQRKDVVGDRGAAPPDLKADASLATKVEATATDSSNAQAATDTKVVTASNGAQAATDTEVSTDSNGAQVVIDAAVQAADDDARDAHVRDDDAPPETPVGAVRQDPPDLLPRGRDLDDDDTHAGEPALKRHCVHSSEDAADARADTNSAPLESQQQPQQQSGDSEQANRIIIE